MKYKGDIPLVVYVNFENTAPSDRCLDPENRNLYAVSCVIVFDFHPHLLKIDPVIIKLSFGHSLQKLKDLSYLTRDQLRKKKKKIAISEMFSSKLKVAADCLLKWFNAKIKSNKSELSLDVKCKYEIENPIDWQ